MSEQASPGVPEPTGQSERTKLFRYLTNELSGEYRQIMGLFAGPLLGDLSAAEVSARLAATGLHLSPEEAGLRCEQLEQGGNLVRGVRDARVPTVKDYLRSRTRYQASKLGGRTRRRRPTTCSCSARRGLVSITGSADEPAKVGISVADIAAGMYAYTGVLTALLRKGRTGQGATVEISTLEALAEWMGFPMYYALYGGKPPLRSGASHAAIAPYGPFPCAGGEQVFLGIQNEREWAIFADIVLGTPELATDERFVSNSLRVAHREDLSVEIARAFSAVSVDDAIDRLEAAGIANARLRDLAGLVEHEQLAARNRWREVDSPVGPIKALVPPATLDGDEPVMGPIPAPGQHTEQILAELGLSSTGTRVGG